jgi:hypothetical protein
MLRIKGTTLKEQEKLCEKDRTQNVGRAIDLNVKGRSAAAKHPGLRQPKPVKKDAQTKAKSKKT